MGTSEEKRRAQEIGDRFDRLHKPLAELAMRLQALNREFPNNPLYTQALNEIGILPDRVNHYASVFWDKADALAGEPGAEELLKEGLQRLLDPLGIIRRGP